MTLICIVDVRIILLQPSCLSLINVEGLYLSEVDIINIYLCMHPHEDTSKKGAYNQNYIFEKMDWFSKLGASWLRECMRYAFHVYYM